MYMDIIWYTLIFSINFTMEMTLPARSQPVLAGCTLLAMCEINIERNESLDNNFRKQQVCINNWDIKENK